MKTDRFSATRAAALLLAGLLLAAGLPADAKTFKIGGTTIAIESSSKKLARELATQVKQVDARFATNRKALRILQGSGNVPGYLPSEVTGLIGDTHKDLDQAIQNVQPSGSEPLRAWVDNQFQQIQGKTPPPGPTASLPGPSLPRVVAVFASLRGFGLPMLAVAKPPKPTQPKPKAAPPKATEPPKPQTIPISTADRLLDEVEEVVRQIFVLADHNDLEVNLWVGSTPARKAKFSFWPQGNLKGATLAPIILQTDGKRGHVLRGLYSYQADLGMGKGVVQQIKYPDPTAPLGSERLDLVKGSRFFCCQFQESYCRHVANEKECR